MQRGYMFFDHGGVAVPRVMRAADPWNRARGLLGRPPPGRSEGLLITRCASVHTCFMGYAIDVVFLDRNGAVLKVVTALAPWRMAAARGARDTLELAAGGATLAGIGIGQVLEWRDGEAPRAPGGTGRSGLG
ncbi:MAG: DUF192 domain-containing protein [Gammaproteobacteria bacterium]